MAWFSYGVSRHTIKLPHKSPLKDDTSSCSKPTCLLEKSGKSSSLLRMSISFGHLGNDVPISSSVISNMFSPGSSSEVAKCQTKHTLLTPA